MDQYPGRSIPRDVKRAVRQRCGFGCVVCGLPLYQYDHMEGWARVQRHRADEITLLCHHHHGAKGGGLLPDAAVREANAEPFNLRAGVSSPLHLYYSGSSCEGVIGGNRFYSSNLGNGEVLIPVIIDGDELFKFRFEDGQLLLTLVALNGFNQGVVWIEDNELVQSAAPWDIELVGQRLIVRAAQRVILVDITFDVPSRVAINRGFFLYNGVQMIVRPNGVLVANNGSFLSGNEIQDYPAGVALGPAGEGVAGAVHLPELWRYPDLVRPDAEDPESD
jgi:hypothetical protein